MPAHAAGRLLESAAEQAGFPALGPAASAAALHGSSSGCTGGSGGTTSSLWGACGELWDPSGPLLDFSFAGEAGLGACLEWKPASQHGLALRRHVQGSTFPDPASKYVHCWCCLPCWRPAGYRQGAAPVPSPPATRSVLEFRLAGMDDTAMLQAALAWANSQPLTEGQCGQGETMRPSLLAAIRGAPPLDCSLPPLLPSTHSCTPSLARPPQTTLCFRCPPANTP